MTSAALSWGCAFLAFGPSLSLLFLITYQKAQLIIVVTTSAFAYLLSSLISSVIWLPFNALGLHNAASLLIPAVLSQFILRCAFVALYHKVERVIQISIENHEETHPDPVEAEPQEAASSSDEQAQTPLSETARLRLEINDWVSGVAAGTGFAGMHAIMLYGTLLASEGGNLGTLYQESCPGMPSLVLSAINAFWFSIADVVWMLLTFFGMRRRLMYQSAASRPIFTAKTWGAMLDNSRSSGNLALLVTIVSHTAATLVTVFNQVENGCVLSLPLLGIVVCLTVAFFVGGISKIYLPDLQHGRGNVDASPSQRHEN